MEDFEYGILCQEKLSVEDPVGVFWLVFDIFRHFILKNLFYSSFICPKEGY